MSTQEQVMESLGEVLVPGAARSLVKMSLIRRVTISDQRVNVTLASAALSPAVQDWLGSVMRATSSAMTLKW